MKKLFFILITMILSLTACVDLEISPKSILTGEDVFSSENGVRAYFSGLYRLLPIEDYRYDATNNGGARDGYFSNLGVYMYYCSTGEMASYNNDGGWRRHQTGYWNDGFSLIRQSNTLITSLPDFVSSLGQQKVDEFIAEAKFIRAYVYFKLVIRYGGMPIIEEPQDINDEAIYVSRSSHADTFDFILKDLDDAIAGLPATSEAGRANSYVAAAIKSRVALHAGTTARYGSAKFSDHIIDGVMLQGIPQSRANDYFKQAWDAAKRLEGVYELHRGNSDKEANYAEIWEKTQDTKESIWLRKYLLNSYHHSYDCIMLPPRFVPTYGCRSGPTLDWVELFDGLPLNADGQFWAFEDDGTYKVYDNCYQLYENVEPRLKANLLLPGRQYRDAEKIDLRSGVIDKKIDPANHGLKKLSVDDAANGNAYNNENSYGPNYGYGADNSPYADIGNNAHVTNPGNRFIWYTTLDVRQQTNQYEGMFTCGLEGPRTSLNGSNNTMTGFFSRKNIDMTRTLNTTGLNVHAQPWTETRYAEVLLNRAEAAIELAQSGEATYNGVNMLQDAFTVINDLRDRAGANLLTNVSELSTDPAYIKWSSNAAGTKGQGGFVEAPNRALQIVRVERYKEMYLENKIYWDLMRWFTFDTQIRNYRRRGLYPFMFANGATVEADGYADGKFIYDGKSCEAGSGNFSMPVNEYYENIPSGELQNNPNLQPNRNQ